MSVGDRVRYKDGTPAVYTVVEVYECYGVPCVGMHCSNPDFLFYAQVSALEPAT